MNIDEIIEKDDLDDSADEDAKGKNK